MFKVSAIVSTYNSERFIRGSLENLVAQTLFRKGELEVIVINSGSQQGEEAVVGEFVEKHPAIVYLRTERETLYAAWNRGMGMARGKYFANANTDDILRPDALELMHNALEAHPEAGLAYADCAWTHTPGEDDFRNLHRLCAVTYPPYHPALTLFYCLTGCLQFWRISALRELGGFDPTLECVGDWEILHRFARAGMRAVLVPEILALFYQNPEGLTTRDGLGLREQKNVGEKYRQEIALEHFYRVDPCDPASLAKGWTALGNLAVACPVPWFDRPVYDEVFALQCFEKAAQLNPGSDTAVHNLAIQRERNGLGELPHPLNKKLSPRNLRSEVDQFGNVRYLYRQDEIPAAVEPIVYQPMVNRIR